VNYWQPGEVILWQDRPNHWQSGTPWGTTPVRVVRDDERGLVAWLATGTPRLMPHPADGRTMRELPLEERFTCELVQARVAWTGPGVLFISPTGKPWSVWLFWDDEDQFSCWYVNLERPHRRDERSTWTGDHELDLVIRLGGTVTLKDADDLDAAVTAGLFTAAAAGAIHADAKLAEESFHRGDWPFAQEWTSWRPPPSWNLPELPADARWAVDLIPH
jgi:predicted RNA-binding protein associated with RNAse of E/G family